MDKSFVTNRGDEPDTLVFHDHEHTELVLSQPIWTQGRVSATVVDQPEAINSSAKMTARALVPGRTPSALHPNDV
ncbi:MAG: hypothetical protein O2868_10670 [Proteobacteria bacterium]|nr:hypothetical protein [Pseudomonadota bacterium]